MPGNELEMSPNMYPFHISCLKATELVEKRAIAGLSFAERLKLGIHTAMCAACTAYEIQSRFIDQALAEGPEDRPVDPLPDQSALLSQKIVKNLPK